MTINKFQGKTEAEAVEKARAEMGQDVVIMNVKEIKPKGIFRAWKNSVFEVTAAKEEKEQAVNPFSALRTSMKLHDNVNVAADEKIDLTIPKKGTVPEASDSAVREALAADIARAAAQKSPVVPFVQQKSQKERELEEKLENLQNMLQKSLVSGEKKEAKEVEKDMPSKSAVGTESFRCMKMIYDILLNNEVHEKYINQILDDVEKVLRRGSATDIILSNVYQKMILKFGQPKEITLVPGHPKVVFFVGPTGVGKTTTIAKIASKFKVDQGKKVAFLTADTYRIAAAEQLRTYANILDSPLSIIYSPEELMDAIESVHDYDLILVDTAGFSHKNVNQREDIRRLLESVDDNYSKEVYLVISATTKYKDLVDITNIYREITDYNIVFTKLDETTTYGNIYNIRMHTGADLSYITNGQNVPDDIEVFDTQKIVKQLLGGR